MYFHSVNKVIAKLVVAIAIHVAEIVIQEISGDRAGDGCQQVRRRVIGGT